MTDVVALLEQYRTIRAIPHRGTLTVTQVESVSWDDSVPLHIKPEKRYLVVVATVFNVIFAILNTDRGELEPRQSLGHWESTS